MTRRPLLVAAALVVGLIVGAAGYRLDPAGGDNEVLGPGQVTVEVGIEHSQFSIGDLKVRAGTLVRFVLRNGDPIGHELIVGDDEVHRRHAQGTEAEHPPVPGEVSVGPGEDGLTTFRFGSPGTVVYACHLPGHVAYGMIGEITVVA